VAVETGMANIVMLVIRRGLRGTNVLIVVIVVACHPDRSGLVNYS
jgi:hypothetical protein